MEELRTMEELREELYNDFIQFYSDESHEEIIERIDLIEFIYNKVGFDFNFLKYQDVLELEDIKETIIKRS